MKKKIISILSVFTALVVTVTPVHAITGGSSDSSIFQSELTTFLGHEASEKEVHDYSLMISTLKAGDLSTNAIAGIIGNVSHESGGNIFALEGYGGKKTTDEATYSSFEDGKSYDYGDTKPSTYKYKDGGEIGGVGHGIVQWSFERANALSSFAESHPEFGQVVVKHWKISKTTSWEQETCHIPNMAGQVAFMASELADGYKNVRDKMKGASTASEAAEIFMKDYEKPATSTATERQQAAENAVKMIEACTGVVGDAPAGGTTSDGDTDLNDSTAIAIVMSSYWSEEELSAYMKLAEINIQQEYLDKATRDKLSQNDLENLSSWEDNVKNSNREYGFIAWMRIIVMWVGIIFTIYIFLLYLAYWFDKLNSIIDLDVLSILTFGRLHVAIDDKEATYSLGKKQDHVTVNHKDICFICITGLIFGVLLITGKFYKLVAGLVNFILRKLG